jgi:restriction endonuclease S subunit
MVETEGATRYFQRKTGQFIYGKQNLHKGAFGVIPRELNGFESSSDLPAFDVADGLRPEWLAYFLKQGNFYKSLVAIAKGAATKRIQPEALFAVELPVPIKEVQDEIIKRMDRCVLEHSRMEHEIAHQQSLLAKLKQAILQEAIQGKLTADWRAAHPEVKSASKLLLRIQAEKARLIADKKLRPEKSLPKITPAEIPFEIPKGWEWCRFGQITRAYEAGSSFKCEDREVVDEEWGVIKTSAVTSGDFAERENKFLRTDAPADTTAQVAVGDLIFCRASGSKGLAGKCAIVRECSRNLLLSDKTIRVPLMEGISQEYVALHNDSAQAKAYFAGLGMGKSTSMNNVTRDDLFMKPVPLPPLAEQAAIVERVESLMATCRALEAEIEQTRTHAADLLQAVLKEAFAPASS